MNLKFTNISSDTATILLYKHFGDIDGMGIGIDGAMIANEIQWLNEFYKDEVKCINIRINSVGGSVHDGLSICSAILNSEIPCDTYIDGMAYSMAGVVAVCGRKVSMVDYGTFMMHNANGGDDNAMLDLITNSLAKLFERNTSMTLDKCKDLMAKETWMTAEECASLGIVNEVIVTKKETQAYANMLELQNLYNKIINPKTKIKMQKLTDLLKLSNEASEESIVAAVEAKQNKIAELEQLLNDAKEELKTLKAEKEAKETAEKEEVITNAINAGKIDAKSKEIYLNSGKTATELKALVAEMKPAYTPVFENNGGVAPELKGRENWTHRDWEKKDPQGLLNIKNNMPNVYAELLKTLNTK